MNHTNLENMNIMSVSIFKEHSSARKLYLTTLCSPTSEVSEFDTHMTMQRKRCVLFILFKFRMRFIAIAGITVVALINLEQAKITKDAGACKLLEQILKGKSQYDFEIPIEDACITLTNAGLVFTEKCVGMLSLTFSCLEHKL